MRIISEDEAARIEKWRAEVRAQARLDRGSRRTSPAPPSAPFTPRAWRPPFWYQEPWPPPGCGERDIPPILKWYKAQFLRHIDNVDGPGCRRFLDGWPLEPNPRGYGSFCMRARTFAAHRVAWVISRDVLLREQDVVRHLCGVPRCVRPDHLAIGTPLDNSHDTERFRPGLAAYVRSLDSDTPMEPDPEWFAHERRYLAELAAVTT